MPKVTEEHAKARRRQILDAAAHSFARNGFHRTTMQDICREAQLSAGAVYSYFASKDEIISAMVEEGYMRNAALIEQATQEGDSRKVLEALADTFFGLLADARDEVRPSLEVQLWAEALRSPQVQEAYQRRFQLVRGSFANIVRRAQAVGDINPELDPEAVAQAMMSFFQGLVLQAAMTGEVEVDQYLKVVKAMGFGSFWQGKDRGR